MKTLFKYFTRGLLFLIPLAATVYVVYWLFTTLDSTVMKLLLGERSQEPDWWRNGLGILILCTVITILGVLSSLFITRPFMQLIDKLFARMPLIKLVYSSIKDLIGAFVGDKKRFDQPVMVRLFPESGAKAIGFITRTSLEFWGLKDELAVYFPQSYNFAGNVLLVHKSLIEPLSSDSSEVMTFLVSGGISGPAVDDAAGKIPDGEQ